MRAFRRRFSARCCGCGRRTFRQDIIEIDGSYFGPRRVRGRRGRAAARKIPVIGLLKREGKVFTQIVPNCSGVELLSVIRGKVRWPSLIHTDGWKACDGLVLDGFRHHRVHHATDEFARGRRHINGIESFWNYAKNAPGQAARHPPRQAPRPPQGNGVALESSA